jgi:hypothetical protein
MALAIGKEIRCGVLSFWVEDAAELIVVFGIGWVG